MANIEPIKFIKSTICNECGYDSLEIYDNRDKPMHIKSHIENGEELLLQRLGARYFKCTNCGADYPIQWINDKPMPLAMSTFDLFFDRFKILSGK